MNYVQPAPELFFSENAKNYELIVVSLHQNFKNSFYMLLLHLRRYPITILLILAITFLSLLPIQDIKLPVPVPLADKWTHMVMYGVLTLAIWFDYKRSHEKCNAGRLFIFAFLAPIAMGGTLELMQAYLTTCRSGEWLDFVANSIGVCIGTIGGLLIRLPKKCSAA